MSASAKTAQSTAQSGPGQTGNGGPTDRDPHKGAARPGGSLRDFHEEERLGRAYDAQLLARLWPFMRPHRRYLWTSLLLILVMAGLGLVRPLVMGNLVANAQNEQPRGCCTMGCCCRC